MPNPFFDAMNRAPTNQMNVGAFKQNLIRTAQAFKANPMGFFLQAKCKIPANIMNDPDAAIGYLLQTGQIDQSRVAWAKQQMANQGFGK